ncbi:MAG: hypothetical protein GYA14_07585, partial [Ignavibacteria bacterium]|nr:hypothetical protein [Ignavibacteria bacterium]
MIGIIPNIDKPDILNTLTKIIEDLRKNDLSFVISDPILKYRDRFNTQLAEAKYLSQDELINSSDFVISIGGDGTMLATAYTVRNSATPILGVNIGKLGFLAEFDIDSFSEFIPEIKTKNYIIEERMALI